MSVVGAEAESFFSGVNGIIPLQYNFLPKFFSLWIFSMSFLQTQFSRSLMVTYPFALITTDSLHDYGNPELTRNSITSPSSVPLRNCFTVTPANFSGSDTTLTGVKSVTALGLDTPTSS